MSWNPPAALPADHVPAPRPSEPSRSVEVARPLFRGAIRFQDDLSRTLELIDAGHAPKHLCIAGPKGCGQQLAAQYLMSGVHAHLDAVVRVLPADLSHSEPSVALAQLRHLWDSAHGGVMHLQDLETFLADAHAIPVLTALRDLMAHDDSVRVVLSGDREAVAQLHALTPDLFMRFAHASVRPFTVEQLAELLASALQRYGLRLDANFAVDVVPVLRKVRAVGDLANGRISSALARTTAYAALREGRALVRASDIDVRSLRTVDTEPGGGFAELDGLIGLTDVKSTVRLWVANYDVILRREELGLNVAGMGQHMVFKGPAGTAKTTVARIVGRILAEVGVLSSGHLVEVQRADLVGNAGDATARRVVEAVKRALGGVLFIDEAYSLMDAGAGGGKEAIDTLLKMMEDYREEFVVIVAGYPLEMEQFLSSNPGLRSRFVHVMQFPSYTLDELVQILDYLARQRGYLLAPDVPPAIGQAIGVAMHLPGFGNGRHMRNLLESAISRQAMRLSGASTDEEIRTLAGVDFAVS